MNRWCIGWIVGLLLTVYVEAARVPLQLYTVDDGLPQSSIFSALQDRQGFLWFGTQNGLCRFNGIEFTVFTREKDGVAEDRIFGLFEDPVSGNLWAGSESNGLFEFDGQGWKQYGTESGLPNTNFRAFLPRAERQFFSKMAGSTAKDAPKEKRTGDAIFLANMAGHLVVRNDSGFHPYLLPQRFAGIRIAFLAVDRHQNLWLATAGHGILQFNGTEILSTVPDNLIPKPVTRLFCDSKDRLWIASFRNGLRMWDGKAMHIFEVGSGQGPLSDTVTALLEDRDGNIWIGTIAGLSQYSERGWIHLTEKDGLPTNLVQVLLQDREGNLWIGTGGGLAKLNSLKFRSFTAREGLLDNSVWAIHQDGDGKMLLGMNRGGLMSFNGYEWSKMETLPVLDRSTIRAILYDSKGRLWVGHHSGLVLRQNGQWQEIRDPKSEKAVSVSAVKEDRQGRIWVATLSGLFIYDGKEWGRVTEKDGLPSSQTRCLFEDREGRMWVGTVGGAAVWNGSEWKSIGRKDGLSADYVMGIAQDAQGVFWFGTFGGGLCRWDGKTWKVYDDHSGLSNNYCYFVLHDRRYLYVGTNKGLNRFDGEQFKVYTSKDGLASSEMNQGAVYRDSEGLLWFGTCGGVSQFNSDLDKPNPVAPPVFIAGISVYDRPVPMKPPLRFKHNQNFLKIEYFGINFTSPEEVRYRYRLEGVDADWVETGQRSISYAKLPPGEYTFQVNAGSEESVWNQKPATVSFTILAPFWATWWFQSGLLLTFLVAFAGYQWYDSRSVRERTIQLNRMVQERTQELEEKTNQLEESNKRLEELDKLKTNFLSTVSHELRTPLTSIRAFSEILLDNPEEAVENRNRFVRIINDESERLTRLIEDLLDLSRIQSGKQKWVMRPLRFADVVDNSIEATAGLVHSKRLSLQIEIPADLPVLVGDFDKLVQVITNLISNSVKFTAEGGQILIAAESQTVDSSALLHCRVVDNGEGIAEDQLEAIFQKFYQVDSTATRTKGGTGLGLAICREIVQYHHGKIWAESVSGQGSTFHLLLPLRSSPVAGESGTEYTPPLPDHSRILVVDDEPHIREFIRYELQKVGYEVLEASSGEEAISVAMKEHPAIILLDVLLPGIDGFEVIHRLKEEPFTRDIEIIVVSIVDDKEKGFHLGAYDYYCKPLDKDRLIRSIARLMDRLPERPKPEERDILLIDDDPSILEALEAMLSAEGYASRKAAEGRQALQMIGDRLPDVIIVDIKMPGMDGYELIKILKSDRRTQHIPIIVLTASDLGQSRTKSLLLGAADYYLKPFSREDFLEGLKRILSANGSAATPHSKEESA